VSLSVLLLLNVKNWAFLFGGIKPAYQVSLVDSGGFGVWVGSAGLCFNISVLSTFFQS